MPTVVAFADETTFLAERVLGVYSANDPDDDKLYFVAQVNGKRRRLDHQRVKSVIQLAPPDEEPIMPPEDAAHVRQLELFPVVRGLLLSPLRVPPGPFAGAVAPADVSLDADHARPDPDQPDVA